MGAARGEAEDEEGAGDNVPPEPPLCPRLSVSPGVAAAPQGGVWDGGGVSSPPPGDEGDAAAPPQGEFGGGDGGRPTLVQLHPEVPICQRRPGVIADPVQPPQPLIPIPEGVPGGVALPPLPFLQHRLQRIAFPALHQLHLQWWSPPLRHPPPEPPRGAPQEPSGGGAEAGGPQQLQEGGGAGPQPGAARRFGGSQEKEEKLPGHGLGPLLGHEDGDGTARLPVRPRCREQEVPPLRRPDEQRRRVAVTGMREVLVEIQSRGQPPAARRAQRRLQRRRHGKGASRRYRGGRSQWESEDGSERRRLPGNGARPRPP